MSEPVSVQRIENELPTFESMLASCNRTIKAVEEGRMTPSTANAIHHGVETVVKIVKLEMEASKLLNRPAVLLPHMLGMPLPAAPELAAPPAEVQPAEPLAPSTAAIPATA